MKRKKRIIRMLAAVLAASVLGSWGVPARAAGPAQVIVTVDGADVTPLAGARRVGTNIEMSMISDAMWQANGNWMEDVYKRQRRNCAAAPPACPDGREECPDRTRAGPRPRAKAAKDRFR